MNPIRRRHRFGGPWGPLRRSNSHRAGTGPWRGLLRLLMAALVIGVLVLGIPLYFAGMGQAPQVPAPPAPAGGDLTLRLYRDDLDVLVELPLEAYVEGVTAAEMPAAFHPEALKAQAVVARTYAVRRLPFFGGRGCDRHPEADLCSDPATGQAYMDEAQMRDRWGPVRYWLYRRRIRQAVRETQGEILVFDGGPIDAVYHSTSGGHTENAAAVWGRHVPYLVGVPSPHEEDSPRFLQEFTFTVAEVAARLDIPAGVIRRALAAGEEVITVVETGVSGRPVTLSIAGTTMAATEFRQRLDLPSTWFTHRWHDGRLTLEVRGYGHGVGMSQYGAQGMAQAGYDYRAILAHYYRGARLRPMFME